MDKHISYDHLIQLGSALGRLHTLGSARHLGPSWWNEYSVSNAMMQLEQVVNRVPPSHASLYEKSYSTIRSIRQVSPMPSGMIHGDCWPPNALITADHLVLIDWECAGTGMFILDLAALLVMSQCNAIGDIPDTADEQRAACIIRGYSQWRLPTNQELDILLEALQFSIAWRAAWLFTRLLQEEWTPSFERLFGRIQRGYATAQSLAPLIRTYFAQGIA